MCWYGYLFQFGNASGWYSPCPKIRTCLSHGIFSQYLWFSVANWVYKIRSKLVCPLTIFFFGGGWPGHCAGIARRQFRDLSQFPWLSLAVTMSHFRTQHETRVRLLAHALYHGLIEEDGGEFLAKTGSLVKDRSLRTRWNRSAFNSILKACDSSQDHRFWTKKVVRNALKCAMTIFLYLPDTIFLYLPDVYMHIL